MEPRQGRYAWD